MRINPKKLKWSDTETLADLTKSKKSFKADKALFEKLLLEVNRLHAEYTADQKICWAAHGARVPKKPLNIDWIDLIWKLIVLGLLVTIVAK